MSTWGSYFSSYVKKQPTATTDTDADKTAAASSEGSPSLNGDDKTVEPVSVEGAGARNSSGDGRMKRFDITLGSVGSLGIGVPAVTNTKPMLRSNSRGAKMAKMFGYGTVKETKVDEPIAEEIKEIPVQEVKEAAVEEVKEIAVEPQTRTKVSEVAKPEEAIVFTLADIVIQESKRESLPTQEVIMGTETSSLTLSDKPSQERVPGQSVPKQSTQDINTTARTVTRTSSSASAPFGKTKRPQRPKVRGQPSASISALDEIMAGLGDFASISTKEAENNKATEKPATQKLVNHRKLKASISALDDIMAGLGETDEIFLTQKRYVPAVADTQRSKGPVRNIITTTSAQYPTIDITNTEYPTIQTESLPPPPQPRPKRSFRDLAKLVTAPKFVQVVEQAQEAESERKLLEYERRAEQIRLEKEEIENQRSGMLELQRKMQEEDEKIAREAEEMRLFYEEEERIRKAEKEQRRIEQEEKDKLARAKREKREQEEREAREEAERLTAQIKAFEREQERLAAEAIKKYEEEERLEEERRLVEEERLEEEERLAEEANRRYQEQRLAEEERLAEEKRLEEEEQAAEQLRYEEERRRQDELYEELLKEEEERYAEQARLRDEQREREQRERVEWMRSQREEEDRLEEERQETEARDKRERLRAQREEQERLEDEERRADLERMERERYEEERERYEEERRMEEIRRQEEQEWIIQQQRADAQMEMERINRMEREENMRMQQEQAEFEYDDRPLTKEEEIRKAEEKIRQAFAGMAAQKSGIPPPVPKSVEVVRPARQDTVRPRPSIRGGLPSGPRAGVGLPAGPRMRRI